MLSPMSPGTATSQRVVWETVYVQALERATARWLVRVEAQALSSSLGAVRAAFTEEMTEAVSDVGEYLNGLGAGPGAVERLTRAIENSPLPDRVHGTVLDTLRAHDDPAQRARALAQALSMDTGSTDLSDAEALHGQSWAASIRALARTASTEGFGHEVLDGLRAAGYNGKRWVARHDKFTRPSHRAVDGDVAPLDQPFEVGGYLLDVPGDSGAPPEVSFNCRCVLVGVKVEGLADMGPASARVMAYQPGQRGQKPLSALPEAEIRARIGEAVDMVAARFPGSMDELVGVVYRPAKRNALANYNVTSGVIEVTDELRSFSASSFAARQASRELARVAASTDPVVYTMVHEMGHHLDALLLRDRAASDQMWREVWDVLGLTGYQDRAIGFEKVQALGWGALSGYGLTSQMEFVAEAFAEYMLSPRPGPVAKVVGAALRRALG